jgi:hypothetical protein
MSGDRESRHLSVANREVCRDEYDSRPCASPPCASSLRAASGASAVPGGALAFRSDLGHYLPLLRVFERLEADKVRSAWPYRFLRPSARCWRIRSCRTAISSILTGSRIGIPGVPEDRKELPPSISWQVHLRQGGGGSVTVRRAVRKDLLKAFDFYHKRGAWSAHDGGHPCVPPVPRLPSRIPAGPGGGRPIHPSDLFRKKSGGFLASGNGVVPRRGSALRSYYSRIRSWIPMAHVRRSARSGAPSRR